MEYRKIMDALSQSGLGAVVIREDSEICFTNDLAMKLLHGKEHRWLQGVKLCELAPELCETSEKSVYAHMAFGEYLIRIPAPKVNDLPEDTELIVFRDATKDAERDMFLDVLSQISESTILCDENTKILFLNDAAENMDGLALEDVKGEEIQNVYEAQDGGGLIVPRSIATRQSFRERRQYYTTKYNKNVDITANTFPIVQNGQVLGGYSLMKDWSMVDNLHKKIIELQDKLTMQTASGKSSNKSALSAKYHLDDIVHISDGVNKIIMQCRQAAKSNSSIMFYGETGTGKELFAQGIHNASPRANGPFLAINCAAIPDNLLESLLFGTEKGAYTGAESRAGLLEQANQGTLLLDELNSMNVNLQAKLLRVLQDGVVRRVGGSQEIAVDVRVLSNVNVPPLEAIKEGKLRQDVYYRLGVVNINIPPLRERKEDISVLTKQFIMRCNAKINRNVRGIDDKSLQMFYNYAWPGNIRELEHVIEHAMNVLPDDMSEIASMYLPSHIQEAVGVPKESPETMVSMPNGSLNSAIQSVERKTVVKVLKENGGNISVSAKALNMSRQSLQYRLRKYNILPEEYKES